MRASAKFLLIIMSLTRLRKASREECIEHCAKATKLCQMFSKLDLSLCQQPITELSTAPQTPRRLCFSNLNEKHLKSYAKEYGENIAAYLISQNQNTRQKSFNCRAAFFDKVIPLFIKMRLKQSTYFKCLQLVELSIEHPRLGSELLKDLVNVYSQSPPEELQKLFSKWLNSIFLPCLLIACEQNETGLNWDHRLYKACQEIELKVLPTVSQSFIQHYLHLSHRLTDFTFADVCADFFSRVDADALDVKVIANLTQKLLIQQLMYDYQIATDRSKQEVVAAVLQLVLDRLQSYIAETNSALLENGALRSEFEILKQRLRRFPKKDSKPIQNRAMHMRMNVANMNDSEGLDGEWDLPNLRNLVMDLESADSLKV